MASTKTIGLARMGDGVAAPNGTAAPTPAGESRTTTHRPGSIPHRMPNWQTCPHCMRDIQVLHGRIRPHAVPIEMRRFPKLSQTCPGA